MTDIAINIESVKLKDILTGVIDELYKAEAKHPNWPVQDIFHQVAIMSEEAGEVAKAALDFNNGSGTEEELKIELMQTAAMCLRILKHLTQS